MKNKKMYVKQKCCKCVFNTNNNINQNNIDYIVNKSINLNSICINCKPLKPRLPIYNYECLINTNVLKYCIFNNQTQQKARSYRNFLLSQPEYLKIYNDLNNR